MSFDKHSLKPSRYALEGNIYFAKFDREVALSAEGVTEIDDLSAAQLAAIETFLVWDDVLLETLERFTFAYYQNVNDTIGGSDYDDFPKIDSASDVWRHIKPRVVEVDEESTGQHHYIRVALACDWEEEHGLEWIVRDGNTVIWVGPSERRMIAEIERGMRRNYADPEGQGFLE